jgi:hypothetical protein
MSASVLQAGPMVQMILARRSAVAGASPTDEWGASVVAEDAGVFLTFNSS